MTPWSPVDLLVSIYVLYVHIEYIVQVGGRKALCDTSAGEVYLRSSPGKVSSVEDCKSLCRAHAKCKSITFFRSGWCSHFSTPCTKTRKNSKALSIFRLLVIATKWYLSGSWFFWNTFMMFFQTYNLFWLLYKVLIIMIHY